MVDVLQCRPLIGCRENVQDLKIGTGGFWYNFIESQAASCMRLQCQNRRFRVFEEGFLTFQQ